MVTKAPIARTDVRKAKPFFAGQKQPAGSVAQPKRDAIFFQPKLAIGPTDDVYERVASAKATATGEGQTSVSSAFEHYVGNLGSRGEPLPGEVRNFYEPKFGYDFSKVKVHTDTVAAKSAQSINALAYTSGESIVFNQGQYSPGTTAGKKLLAHELTHVVQQKGMVQKKIQRSSANFCKAYPTAKEAADAEWWIRHTYMMLEGLATYGTEVNNLYESYLDRKKGDSLTPRVFDSEDSYIHNCFADDGAIEDDMDAVIDVVGANLSKAPGPPLRDGQSASMSLLNFMSAADMDDRPINFSNPLSVSGHIAGNVGSSDAGKDYRKITGAAVVITKRTFLGTGYHSVKLIPDYEVFDAIDFCPGDPGSPAEQLVTTTFSRLEASDEAYDMPFKVVFSPEPRSKRFWF